MTLAPGPGAIRAYLWVGGAVAGLGVVQHLAEGSRDTSASVLVAALVCGAAVAMLPRSMLWATLGISASVIVMVAVVETPTFSSFLAMMVAAFTLTRYAGRRTALLGAAAVLCTTLVVVVPAVRDEGPFGIIYPIFYFGCVAVLGWLSRQRAVHVHALQELASTLERERHQQAELAAAGERERLAREMHDVISHGVSLMVVQAEAAGEVLLTKPDAAARALEAVADTGRAAMTDLHRMLGVLHGTATDLAELSTHVRATGIDVTLDVDPSWSALSEPLRLALFRVAQEATTNVVRHAEGANEVSITFARAVGAISLEVRDNGRGNKGAQEGMGSGLVGLRDRLGSLGGVLDAGAIDGGGFAVRASLPEGAR